MDNLSHSLTGLALSRAGLNRITPRAAMLLFLSANAPDIDIVALARGQLVYLEAHRGPTHSLIALPVMAALCVLLTAAVYRQRLPWLKAWLACCVGTGSHLMLDSTNNYGIRLLLPFSGQWFHFDLNSLTDGPILIALGIAAVWPSLSRLVSGEIGESRRSAGRGIAIAMIIFCTSYDIGRYYLHQRAVAQLESRLYAGAPPLEAAALPTPLNPFQWRGIVATETTFLEFNVNTLGQLNTDGAGEFFRIPVSDVMAKLRRTPAFGYFLYFARFPVWSVQTENLRDGQGQRIELTDLRFGEPGRGDFHCIAVASATGDILGSWFTYGSGTEFGWNDPRGQ
jgi:inner membrane protein